MRNLKSHLLFTKAQQSGIFLLALLIVLLLCIYFFVDFSSDAISYRDQEVMAFQQEVDSLKAVEQERRKPKIYPFNPNFITDYKGYVLGMTDDEIDRFHRFRAQDKWINSVQQFQEVTLVSDSLLTVISPYFKFPDWVTNPKPRPSSNSYSNRAKTYAQKIDLNTATAQQLQRINGIGKVFSNRIIRYRNTFVGGFIDEVQLYDVYGLTPEVIERIKADFAVKTPRQIKKIDLNSATVEQLVTIQHIDYDIAYNIVEARTLRDGFKSFEELTKVNGFPVDKIDIIKLYLLLN